MGFEAAGGFGGPELWGRWNWRCRLRGWMLSYALRLSFVIGATEIMNNPHLVLVLVLRSLLSIASKVCQS